MPRKKKETSLAAPASNLLEVQTTMLSMLGFVPQVELTETYELFDQEVTGLQALGVVRERARLQVKALEDERKAAKAPHLAKGKAVDAEYKPSIESAESVVQACTERLEEYAKAQMLERFEATKRMCAGDDSALEVLSGRSEPLPAEVNVRQVLEYEVVDLSQVPIQFVQPNDKAIAAYLKNTNGLVEIPGIKIERSVKVTA